MSTIRKIVEDDGSFSVISAGHIIRGSLTSEEADDVVSMLRPMDADED